MSQRERCSEGAVIETASPPAGRAATPRTASTSNGASNGTTHFASRWEAIYRKAPLDRQADILALARRQGLLNSHRLPAANGDKTAAEEGGQLLLPLLEGPPGDLEPVRAAAVEFCDHALDLSQRDAAAKALATPDVCLIQGFPGTGKTRVVTEIVTQAALRGERVLLIAPSTAAIDRVLELAGPREALCPIRCVGADEDAETLPPAIQAMTFAGRRRHLSEQPLQAARQDLETLEQRCERLRREAAIFEQLQKGADRFEELERQAEILRQRRSQIAREVEEEAATLERGEAADVPRSRFGLVSESDIPTRSASEGSKTVASEGSKTVASEGSKMIASEGSKTIASFFLCAITEQRKILADFEEELVEIRSRLVQQLREQAVLASRLVEARRLVESRRLGRWWTPAWWRAAWHSSLAALLPALERDEQKLQDSIDGLDCEVERLTRARTEAEQKYRDARRRFLDAEAAARQAACASLEAPLQEEQNSLRGQWQAACEELGGALSETPGLVAVQAGLAGRRQELEKNEQQCAFAREWAACLEEAARTLAPRLVRTANLVASTLLALPDDSHFGDRGPHPVGFDLLVLQEADQVTKADFLKVAGRARRWVLVGEPAWESAAPIEPAKRVGNSNGHRAPTALSPHPQPTGFFQTLWQALHADPRRLPYAWFQKEGRLHCRLRPVLPEQARWLETEHVADFPEVELRILAPPRAKPVLSEVIFPPTMSIAQAKEYIYRELEELPLWTAASALYWSEEPDQVVLRLGETLAETVAVDLTPGVREVVAHGTLNGMAKRAQGAKSLQGGNAWHTCRIEFSRQAGWDRQRAEEWLQRHWGWRDLGRTARLEAPHRMHPDLACFLFDLLYGAHPARARGENGPSQNGHAARVEFVSVTATPAKSPAEAPANGRAKAGREAPPCRGAGLEVDLADRRQRERLPAELRPELPNHGIVNYREAQAVVRTLESLAGESELNGQAILHAAYSDTPSPPSSGERAGVRGERGESLRTAHAEYNPLASVAVIALYPAQAALIRRLVRQSPLLAQCGFEGRIDVPSAFRQQESQTVLLSLTRSHSQRAVSFGEGPRSLALALTRARSKLILFGDPGTLIRRSQWVGPLDHLNPATAAQERDLLARLAGYLEGQGACQGLFHLRGPV